MYFIKKYKTPFSLGKIYKSLRLRLPMVHLDSRMCQPFIHLLLTSNVRACEFYRPRYYVSNKRVLDFHSTISLADYSQEQPRYSFVPIKDAWLAAAHPLCSYHRGLRHFSSFATIDFCFFWQMQDLNLRLMFLQTYTLPTEPIYLFDRRRATVVVSITFDCGNATRLQCFPLPRTHTLILTVANINGKRPRPVKS